VHGRGCTFRSFSSAKGEAWNKHIARRPRLQFKQHANIYRARGLTHPYQPALLSSRSSSFFSLGPQCSFVVLGSHGCLLC
jgi:hypothetical protein